MPAPTFPKIRALGLLLDQMDPVPVTITTLLLLLGVVPLPTAPWPL